MKIKSIILILLVAFLFTSCGKRKSAGLGGTNTLIVSTEHHGLSIDSFTVSVKFNAQDAPANNQYDLTQVCKLNTATNVYEVKIENLKEGEYYLFSYGWDPNIVQQVKGGIPLKIKSTNQTKTATVPVTED
jgi:hypothetical protein